MVPYETGRGTVSPLNLLFHYINGPMKYINYIYIYIYIILETEPASRAPRCGVLETHTGIYCLQVH